MAREEVTQHLAEQEGAAALEGHLVDLQGDLQPAPEADRPGHRQAPHHGRHGHRLEALDLPLEAGIARAGVQFKRWQIEFQQAHVLHNQGVSTGFVALPSNGTSLFQFVVTQQRV